MSASEAGGQPGFVDVLRASTEARVADIHVSLPGRVESYDHTQQRAAVKPLVSRVYRDGREDSLPVVPRVPVVFPRGAGWSLTAPVQAGDLVGLIVAERSLERWLAGSGAETQPGDPRKHDLTDCWAVPGLYPFGAASPAENNTDLLLRLGGVRLRFQPGKLELSAGGTAVLGLLSQFMQQFISARTTVENEALTTQAAVTVLKAQLDAIRGAA